MCIAYLRAFKKIWLKSVPIGGRVGIVFLPMLKNCVFGSEGIPYHGDPVMKGSCHLLPHFAGGLKYHSPGCLRLFLPEPIFLPCSAGLLAEKSRHEGLEYIYSILCYWLYSDQDQSELSSISPSLNQLKYRNTFIPLINFKFTLL